MSDRPLIAVDIGNSSLKLARFDLAAAGAKNSSASLPDPAVVTSLATGRMLADFGEPEELFAWLPEEPLQWRVASVHRRAEQRLRELLAARRSGDRYELLTHEHIPLAIETEQPERVGMDRLVAAAAVDRLRTVGRPAIVVDAGTAITVDALSGAGAFLGGAILPGIPLVAKALSTGTDLLPSVAVDPRNPPPAIGRSTEDAIRSGLHWGTIGAVREVVARVTESLGEEPELFVGGGDGLLHHLASLTGARYVPHLVLAGIAILPPIREP